MNRYRLTIVVDIESESANSEEVLHDAMSEIIVDGLSDDVQYGSAKLKSYVFQIEKAEE